MKKYVLLILTMVLCAGMLSGCGASYDAKESTVFFLKDGGVISTDVEAFDTGIYDADALENYVKDAIADYSEENGDGRVKLKKLVVEEGVATLTLEYASVEDYSSFSGIEVFHGSVAESLAAGYTFDAEFASVEGEIASAETADFVNNSDFKVAVIRANVNVVVKGKVYYTSVENVASVEKDTVAIAEGANILGGETDSFDEQIAESTEADTQTEDNVTETMEPVGDGSISEDEIAAIGEDETEQIVFDFGEDTTSNQSSAVSSEYSNVYTYIIYK